MADVNYSAAEIDAMIGDLDAHAASDPLMAGVRAEDPRTWREVFDAGVVTSFDVVYAHSFLPAKCTCPPEYMHDTGCEARQSEREAG